MNAFIYYLCIILLTHYFIIIMLPERSAVQGKEAFLLIQEAQKPETFFCSCIRQCELKKCCKKYKRGKRCKSCPKR
ncbi:hypothetical protein D3C71_374330 [compost metagenome]